MKPVSFSVERLRLKRWEMNSITLTETGIVTLAFKRQTFLEEGGGDCDMDHGSPQKG